MSLYEIKVNEQTTKGKYILQFLKENNVKVKDPTKMTKKEFYAKIDKARKQAEQGEVFELKYEDISKFLGLE